MARECQTSSWGRSGVGGQSASRPIPGCCPDQASLSRADAQNVQHDATLAHSSAESRWTDASLLPPTATGRLPEGKHCPGSLPRHDVILPRDRRGGASTWDGHGQRSAGERRQSGQGRKGGRVHLGLRRRWGQHSRCGQEPRHQGGSRCEYCRSCKLSRSIRSSASSCHGRFEVFWGRGYRRPDRDGTRSERQTSDQGATRARHD